MTDQQRKKSGGSVGSCGSASDIEDVLDPSTSVFVFDPQFEFDAPQWYDLSAEAAGISVEADVSDDWFQEEHPLHEAPTAASSQPGTPDSTRSYSGSRFAPLNLGSPMRVPVKLGSPGRIPASPAGPKKATPSMPNKNTQSSPDPRTTLPYTSPASKPTTSINRSAPHVQVAPSPSRIASVLGSPRRVPSSPSIKHRATRNITSSSATPPCYVQPSLQNRTIVSPSEGQLLRNYSATESTPTHVKEPSVSGSDSPASSINLPTTDQASKARMVSPTYVLHSKSSSTTTTPEYTSPWSSSYTQSTSQTLRMSSSQAPSPTVQSITPPSVNTSVESGGSGSKKLGSALRVAVKEDDDEREGNIKFNSVNGPTERRTNNAQLKNSKLTRPQRVLAETIEPKVSPDLAGHGTSQRQTVTTKQKGVVAFTAASSAKRSVGIPSAVTQRCNNVDSSKILAEQNSKLKASLSTDSRKPSIREVREWERRTGRKWHELSADERVRINEEIAAECQTL